MLLMRALLVTVILWAGGIKICPACAIKKVPVVASRPRISFGLLSRLSMRACWKSGRGRRRVPIGNTRRFSSAARLSRNQSRV
jgi:hypothetical protein